MREVDAHRIDMFPVHWRKGQTKAIRLSKGEFTELKVYRAWY